MITTGGPGNLIKPTEVVDVESVEICADLADFPVKNTQAVGANLDGSPIVCGGYFYPTYYQTCYKFTNAGWQVFTSMKEPRYLAAGVMYKNEFHVFGGSSGRWTSSGVNLLKTSEIISIDGGVRDGPELLEAVHMHAITFVSSTVSILSGGREGGTTYPSTRTWYFNHETNVFSSGPNLLVGRERHGSASIVDKVTKAKIPVIAGGYNGFVWLDSTELLINGMWQSGTIQCPKMASLF